MYEKFIELGIAGAILVVLFIVINKWMKSNKEISDNYQFFIKKVQEDSNQREERLMKHINEQDKSMLEISKTLKDIDAKINNIERKIETG